MARQRRQASSSWAVGAYRPATNQHCGRTLNLFGRIFYSRLDGPRFFCCIRDQKVTSSPLANPSWTISERRGTFMIQVQSRSGERGGRKEIRV